MRFKKGDRVLVMGNAYGMNVRGVQWPIKAKIYNMTAPNIPNAPNAPDMIPGSRFQEHYQIVFDDPKLQRELAALGYQSPSRWIYPVSLLRRDKYCPVCESPIDTYGERNLVSEHHANGGLCYGSHSPLDF